MTSQIISFDIKDMEQRCAYGVVLLRELQILIAALFNIIKYMHLNIDTV